ncbi:hypothetical protein H257_17823 [Aphanomyces astaci]|uniref:C2H2-type domain-containing protein n=1 Tax=Aphanomyces astaci TaxID=112090 RepID=W4FD97_APHAT|nr:hypothetical protein H257_17823 [Aphanomyces astaci]ETV65457.1 hypothetical protein H257_17823 [Aphanomyces astaci]|eukprot:XP_009845068.1 hypothetical protein H257_17823 [Aphanomyces astaci]
MADPSKKRVVCPVVDCEDKFVADTNKKSHYTNVHFTKNPSIPVPSEHLFVDHALRCATEQEAMESQNEEVAPPVATKSLTSKQKAAKRKVAAAAKRSSKK